jgi:hypothetical protein
MTYLADGTGVFRGVEVELLLCKPIGRPLNGSRTAQQSRRKEKEAPQKRQNAMHSYPGNAKRQKDQPNNGVHNQCEQRERPAEEEQDAPQDKRNHGNPLTSYYARVRLEVPSFAKLLSFSLRAIDTGTSASISM